MTDKINKIDNKPTDDKIISKVEEQKIKLQQKKNRLAAEETRLKLKEQKMRTKSLIELGSLIIKAGLDILPMNTLYGALLSLIEELEANNVIKAAWTTKGNTALNQEKQEKTAIILKLEEQPSGDIKELIKPFGLMWNKFRAEWYGYCSDLTSLKTELKKQGCKYNIETIDEA